MKGTCSRGLQRRDPASYCSKGPRVLNPSAPPPVAAGDVGHRGVDLRPVGADLVDRNPSPSRMPLVASAPRQELGIEGQVNELCFVDVCTCSCTCSGERIVVIVVRAVQ